MELQNQTVVQIPEQQPTDNKWRNIGDKIKRISYYIVALINIAIPALISAKYLTMESPFVMISAGICSVCLVIASWSDNIETIIQKYGLTNDKIILKLDDMQDMANDLQSIKNLVKSSHGSLSSRSISNNEPIHTGRSEIKTKTPRVKAHYNRDTNIIELEYIDENPTPR